MLALAANGCGAVATQDRPLTLSDALGPPPEQSLVPSDAATLDDAEIARILDARPQVPSRPRIALVHLQHNSADWVGMSSQEVVNAIGEGLVGHLKDSHRVSDASYLPAFLFSRSPSVAQLREAAARYQADLVLIFSTDCSLHQQYNLFSANEARAYCNADSALLDVRTGLVPFAARADGIVTEKQAQAEYSVREALRRAELQGVDKAMQTDADAVVRFLDSARIEPEPSGGPESGREPAEHGTDVPVRPE
jgi:hypothetical protein